MHKNISNANITIKKGVECRAIGSVGWGVCVCVHMLTYFDPFFSVLFSKLLVPPSLPSHSYVTGVCHKIIIIIISIIWIARNVIVCVHFCEC